MSAPPEPKSWLRPWRELLTSINGAGVLGVSDEVARIRASAVVGELHLIATAKAAFDGVRSVVHELGRFLRHAVPVGLLQTIDLALILVVDLG